MMMAETTKVLLVEDNPGTRALSGKCWRKQAATALR